MAKGARASVECVDLGALESTLKELGDKESGKIVTGVLRDASKGMLKVTVAHAPVDSGLMKENLTYRALKRRRGRFGFRIGFKNTRALIAKSADLPLYGPYTEQQSQKKRYFYPAAVEYGTSHAPPHPFMRPAFDQYKDFAVKQIAGDLTQKVAEAAVRLMKERQRK